MLEFIVRWDGQKVSGCRSTGARVFAACDWRDLVLASGEPIEAKAKTTSTQLSAFERAARTLLCKRDGRYCDLQSIRSEDTVTWSVFGAGRVKNWTPNLLELAFGPAHRPTSGWQVSFWKRLPHPDTGVVEHGPEADVTLQATGGWFYAIEAKWLADFSGTQGRAQHTSQLEMRALSVKKNGPHPERRGVIAVVPSASRYPPANRPKSVFRHYFDPDDESYKPRPAAVALGAVAVTWERVADLLVQRSDLATVVQYLRWRLDNTPEQ